MANVPPNPPRGGHPPPLFTEPELHSYIPPQLSLAAAHVFLRHGERTPLLSLANLGIPPRWAVCAVNGNDEHTPVINPSLTTSTNTALTRSDPAISSLPVRHQTEIALDANDAETRGRTECSPGQLTDLGRKSGYRLGSALRELYVEKFGLVPPTFDTPSAKHIYFRSTYYPRAIQTLEQVISGLYPAPHLAIAPLLRVREPREESLLPNNTCPKLVQLGRELAAQAAHKHNPNLAKFDNVTVPLLGAPLRVDGDPTALAVYDLMISGRAHGFRVPDALFEKDLHEAHVHAIMDEWFGSVMSPKRSRLSNGPLFGDLLRAFRETPSLPTQTTIPRPEDGDPNSDADDDHQRPRPIRLGIYSTHDITLSEMLISLGVQPTNWLVYNSNVTFELLKQKPDMNPSESSSSSSNSPSWFSSLFKKNTHELSTQERNIPTYVRTRCNGENLVIPACKPPGKHFEGSQGTICTLEAFESALNDIQTTYSEWRKECTEGVKKERSSAV